MSDLMLLIIVLIVLAASFIFWKLSQIKWRRRCLIPLHWRIAASLILLLLIPALIFFSLAIVVILSIVLLVSLAGFVASWFKFRKK